MNEDLIIKKVTIENKIKKEFSVSQLQSKSVILFHPQM